jgi:hypothetical protein
MDCTMTTIEVYRGAGTYRSMPLAEMLGLIEEHRRASIAAPFCAERISAVNELSAGLLANRHVLRSPAMAYFGHWIRRSAVRNLEAGFNAGKAADTLCAPRGVVLHMPPRNVETIFLFSWVLSYLAGNMNVVRLPSQLSDTVMSAVELLATRLDRGGAHPFIRYAPSETVNAALSHCSDGRVVWGGDEKVRMFERLPLRNGGKAIWFGDRYSYSVLSGRALAQAGTEGIEALAHRLNTDIFTFDQMACSSPHKLFVVGSRHEHVDAVTALLAAVDEEARRHDTGIPPSHAIRKLTEALALSSTTEGWRMSQPGAELVAVIAPEARSDEDRVGGGFLVVEFIDDLMDIAGFVQQKHQTLTYFGFEKSELAKLAHNATMSGLSRIVPIGQALNFDAVWDGYDLVRELTRTIRLG